MVLMQYRRAFYLISDVAVLENRESVVFLCKGTFSRPLDRVALNNQPMISSDEPLEVSHKKQ